VEDSQDENEKQYGEIKLIFANAISGRSATTITCEAPSELVADLNSVSTLH
jgi:hypothetical protein